MEGTCVMKKSLIFALTLSLSTLFTSTATLQEVDYNKESNWIYRENSITKPVDVFFIAPSVLLKDVANANIEDADFRQKIKGASNMERGIYDGKARMFSPYYRQATLPVFYLPENQAKPYHDRAYKDVARSFRYYLNHYHKDRPLIIAGFSQGAKIALRLMEKFRPHSSFRKDIIAVYAIGYNFTDAQAKNINGLHPAKGELDTNAIIVFNTESPNINSSLLVPEGIKSYCINPLNWKTDATPAPKSNNHGSCFTNYDANINKEIPLLTGAYIDTSRGVLKVTDITESQYPAYILPNGVYHIYDYQFFYRNLQENINKRIHQYFSNISKPS